MRLSPLDKINLIYFILETCELYRQHDNYNHQYL